MSMNFSLSKSCVNMKNSVTTTRGLLIKVVSKVIPNVGSVGSGSTAMMSSTITAVIGMKDVTYVTGDIKEGSNSIMSITIH